MLPLQLRPFIIGLFAVLVTTNHGTDGKVFTRCEAAIELQTAGISRSFISNWVCLMEHVSGLNTELVSGPYQASSRRFGILQISSGEWCTRGRRGGLCNLKCESLKNDKIQDDIACAKRIFDSRGFGAWDGWVKHCKNKPLPNVSQCRR